MTYIGKLWDELTVDERAESISIAKQMLVNNPRDWRALQWLLKYENKIA